MNEKTTSLFARMSDCQAALIKTDVNRFYFLGLDTGDAGILLLLPEKAYFIIDSRYIEIARKEIKNAELVLEKKPYEQVRDLLRSHGVNTLYVESKITLEDASHIKEAMPTVELVTNNKLSASIDALRSIKNPNEIDLVRRAQKITDDCFSYIQGYIKPGVTEIDVALEMEMFMRRNGATKLAFDIICVAGKNTSLPHGSPSNNVIKEGDFVTLDFGANVDGYCTDMTRTIAIGHVTDEQRQVYETVLKAQLAATNSAKGGMRGCDVDKIARNIIYDAGYEGCFGHGLGHSLGIEIHENPRYSPTCEDIVRSGMLMTIEPGVYLEGKFGVRIEDTVIVQPNGVEVLANSDKNLIIL